MGLFVSDPSKRFSIILGPACSREYGRVNTETKMTAKEIIRALMLRIFRDPRFSPVPALRYRDRGRSRRRW